MLGTAQTSHPKHPPQREADESETKRDPAADFIHDLAESGIANELSTVKAASDAIEGEADEGRRKKPKSKTPEE